MFRLLQKYGEPVNAPLLLSGKLPGLTRTYYPQHESHRNRGIATAWDRTRRSAREADSASVLPASSEVATSEIT
jgi:hypothetical protein